MWNVFCYTVSHKKNVSYVRARGDRHSIMWRIKTQSRYYVTVLICHTHRASQIWEPHSDICILLNMSGAVATGVHTDIMVMSGQSIAGLMSQGKMSEVDQSCQNWQKLPEVAPKLWKLPKLDGHLSATCGIFEVGLFNFVLLSETSENLFRNFVQYYATFAYLPQLKSQLTVTLHNFS